MLQRCPFFTVITRERIKYQVRLNADVKNNYVFYGWSFRIFLNRFSLIPMKSGRKGAGEVGWYVNKGLRGWSYRNVWNGRHSKTSPLSNRTMTRKNSISLNRHSVKSIGLPSVLARQWNNRCTSPAFHISPPPALFICPQRLGFV